MRIIYAVAAVLFAGTMVVDALYGYTPAHTDENSVPQRIVSLSPSVTESLYFLGQFDKVIAVSRYCEYPPEAIEKPKVGGISDVNFEAVIAMKPDIVILSHMQEDAKERLDSLGVKTLLLHQDTFDGMLSSLEVLGEALGAKDQADTLVAELKQSVNGIIQRVAPYKSKSALFVVSRDAGGGKVDSVVAAGNDGYYSKILELLHAENPFSRYAAYSNVSKEGLYWVNPDVIIELLYTPAQAATSFDEWKTMPELNAVKNKQICSVTDSYGYIPGPRFPLLVEAAARCIYPEAFE